MNKLRLLFYTTCICLTFTACSSDNDDNENTGNNNTNANVIVGTSTVGNKTMPIEITHLEFPKVKGGNSMILVHKALLNKRTNEYGVNYSVEWDTDKKSQRWSCYQMYNGISVANVQRYRSDTDQYPRDNSIPSAYQFTSDPFWRTGYDHGHICPSADRLGSEEANIQTFYLSNMQPQLNGFNAKVWANMENQLRTWNRTDFRDTLYVCKGGTIDNPTQILETIGQGLIVPKYFYMAIL